MNTNNLAHQCDENETANEALDPRIQVELERLNKACGDINQMENELEEAKSMFITSKNRQTQRLEYLQKKLGSCITKSKPYYESLEQTERLQIETQKAVLDFQKANSIYKTAKETLTVAENSLDSGEIPDVWQEHLSSTVTKINISKKIADQAEENHRHKALEYQMSEKKSQYLEKDLKRHISKSKLYYDEKSRWNIQMEAQKMRIHDLEQALMQTKITYKEAMINLSKISEEIHNKRKLERTITKQSDESRENDTQIKKYLDLYKISLPNEQEQTNNEKISEYLNKNTHETVDTLEYVSLGLNSTASNSRCSSPSTNSIGIEEWKENPTNQTVNQAINRLELLSDKSELSSKANSFSSSSMSRGSSNEYHLTHSYRSPPQRSLTIDTGFRSLSSEFDVKAYESFDEPQHVKPIKLVKTASSFNSNDYTPSSSNETGMLASLTIKPKLENLTNNNNKKTNKNNQETPLLSNLLLHHSTRF